MKKENLKIALLGLGLDNQALLKLLAKSKQLNEITICDHRPKEELTKINTKNLKINYQLGDSFNKNLFEFDVLFRSPGWPIFCPGIKEAVKRGSYLSSALEIFFNICPTKNIIGITGTKGKGTTSTLIYKIIKDSLKESEKNVYLGGNIGLSPLEFLKKIKPGDFVVLELSSFQLENLNHSPKIAVFTNFFSEHLAPADPNNPNFHKSLNAYFQAKLNIASHDDNKFLIAPEDLTKKLEKNKTKITGKILTFTSSSLPSKMQGTYNQKNIAAAVEVVKLLKIKKSVYEKTINNFKNLENRLELIREKDAVRYFNNSFSTTPESTALDLLSFNENIIQLAGGADKGADFKSLSKVIKDKVKLLILFPGKGSDKIEIELQKINYPKNKIKKVKSMTAAVNEAHKKAEAQDVVLLSTACASFGLFKNYKERGRVFKEAVKNLK